MAASSPGLAVMHPGRHWLWTPALSAVMKGLELRGYHTLGKGVSSGVTVAFGEPGRGEQGEVVS